MRTRSILISLYTFYNMRYSSAGESGSGRKGKGFMQEYTLKTKFAALKVSQANEYLMDFGKIIEKAFVQSILQNTLRIRARILMNGLQLSGVAIC